MGFLSEKELTRSLQEEDSSCVFEETSLSDIGALVFLGNLGLFAAILLGIFVVHIVVASGAEAYWLSKVRRLSETLHPSTLMMNSFSIRTLSERENYVVALFHKYVVLGG